MAERFREWTLILSLTISLLLACYIQWPVFSDPLAINDDVRNQIYWMARLQDPGLFPGDLIARYFTQPSLVSPVVKGIYELGAIWVDPLRITQFLPFAIVLLCTFLIFRLGEKHGGTRYAFWVAFAFNLSIWIINPLTGGLARSFFPLLFLLFLRVLASARYGLLVPVLWLQVFMYPTALYGSSAVLVWERLASARDALIRRKKPLGWILLAVVGGLVLLLLRYLSGTDEVFRPSATLGDALSMPEFYRGGRVVLFHYGPPKPDASWSLMKQALNFLPPDKWLLPALLTLGGMGIYQKILVKRFAFIALPGYVTRTAWGSIILYFLAFPCLFVLYVPDRYIVLLYMMVPPFLLGGLLYEGDKRLQKLPFLAHRAAVAMQAMLVLWGASHFWRDALMQLDPSKQTMLAYVARLSKDTLIAAPSPMADNIPAFSRRSAFVTYEASIPFHLGFYGRMKERLGGWLEAYYAQDAEIVLRFARRYRIGYLLVNETDFQPRKLKGLHNRYFHAFDKRFFEKHLGKEPEQAGFIMPKLARTCAVFSSGPYALIPASRLTECL